MGAVGGYSKYGNGYYLFMGGGFLDQLSDFHIMKMSELSVVIILLVGYTKLYNIDTLQFKYLRFAHFCIHAVFMRHVSDLLCPKSEGTSDNLIH